MATEVKERSVPKPVFTDAEAGAQEFPSWQSRSYNYFEPRKRRATVYEDVTIDVQPDPARHLTQGWVYSFANGDAGYPQEWSALKSSNWHAFLDPNEEWEQTIYRNNANVVRQISQNIEHGRTAHVFQAMNPAWVKVLARHVFAWAHLEQGIGMHVYTPAQRDAPTNMINNAICVGAVHKLRFAQDLILYNLALSEEIEGFEGSVHKEVWQEDPIWQPTRELVEGLTGIRDWSEAFFATTVVFEPLVGELFRSGFVMQAAALQGDFVTPTIMGAGESDAAREQRGARALFRMLADDEAHGAANKATMQGWLDEWTPKAVERRPQPAADLVADLREGRALRGLDGALPRALRRACSPTSASRPRRRSRHDRVRFRSHVLQQGGRDADEQPGRLRRRRRDARQEGRHDHRAAVDDPRRRRQPDRLRLRGDRGGARLGGLRQQRLRRDHVDALRAYGCARRPRVMFANPEDAAEYIDFDLQVVE